MSLVACKECKKTISDTAKTCPKCGVSDPAPPPPGPATRAVIKFNIFCWRAAGVGILGMLVWLVVKCSIAPPFPSSSKQARLEREELMREVDVPYYARKSASCRGECCAWNEKIGVAGVRQRVMKCTDGKKIKGKTCKGFECW